jgi:4-hydroxythreonine-4-phosphate dehydrogenase
MGDPAGIGPEVVVMAAASAAVARACRLTVFGDPQVLARARQVVGERGRDDDAIEAVVSAAKLRGGSKAKPRASWWKPSRSAGEAAFTSLDAAARATQDGQFDGLVTAPLSKYWIDQAGHHYDGHTGYLSELAQVPAVMMLAGRRLRVVLVTTHIALADVPKRLKTKDIVRCAKVTVEHLKLCGGIARPRLAIAALNPHAGESGLFGDEEARIIGPAVKQLKALRINAVGPLPADTLFADPAAGDYDAVICMYHDQALIPLKLLEFGRSVNISMGLPFVRTSPDHGTAYDLAGTGKADPGSMIAAILAGARLARGVKSAPAKKRSNR